MTAPGVNVLGYLREAKGIGEAARLYAAALRAAGVPVRTGALDAGSAPGSGESHDSVSDLRPSADHPVDLICLNAPELERLLADGARLPGRRRVGVWAWEVDPAPAGWAAVARELDEVWVYSRYVAELLGRALPVPVVVAPLPILTPAPAPAPGGGASGEGGGESARSSGEGGRESARPSAGDSPFTFLFLFDFHSMLRRKNPLGLIEAYTTAFAADEGTRLLVKTFNGDLRPDDLAAVREAGAGRPDVEVVDRFLPAAERDRLLASCDCYVSLHRSEGFGLTLGEAMALGRPAVATGFGGNLDFMPPGTSWLLRWRPAAVGEGVEVYPARARWADPDVGHASQAMRSVFEDRAEAAERAERGRAFVTEHFSPAACGEIARSRLELLAGRSAGGRGAGRGAGGGADLVRRLLGR